VIIFHSHEGSAGIKVWETVLWVFKEECGRNRRSEGINDSGAGRKK